MRSLAATMFTVIHARTLTTFTRLSAKSPDVCLHRRAPSILWRLSWRRMLDKKLLTAEDLPLYFEADFENGLLFWKRRDVDLFATKRSATIWNVRFAGQLALNANHITGYKCGQIFGVPLLAHRVLFAMKHGYWPKEIDHINGNRTDNTIKNLREVTRLQNSKNQKIPAKNTSGHIGVSWNKRDKRWTAYITVNKKRKALGNFINIDDAIACRIQHQTHLGFHENHGRLA